MSNEWVAVERMGANRDGEPITYTIDEATDVSLGQLVALADDRTVVVADIAAPVAGVAAEEHVGGFGVTRISVETNGIYRATASEGILIGEMLGMADAAGSLVRAENDAIEVPASFGITHSSMRALDAVTDGTELSVRLLC